MKSDLATNFATELVLPAWWVRAYEAALRFEDAGEGAMAQAEAAGLSPALNPFELTALATVLSTLQNQIISGEQDRLSLKIDDHLKHAGTVARTRRFAFEKILQLLAGLRVFARTKAGLISYAPFRTDQWRRGQNEVDYTLELALSPLGTELMLGACDAYQELLRLAKGEQEAAPLLGRNAVLNVARSVFLDLSGIEQLLYIRIERAMQWEFRWLQLEGIFGIEIAELFQGAQGDFFHSSGRVAAPDGGRPGLARHLRILARLGKKLAGHGILQAEVQDHYLALGQVSRGMMLVWQGAPARFGEESLKTYREVVARCLLVQKGADAAAGLARLCLGPAAAFDKLSQVQALWAKLAATQSPAFISGLEVEPGQSIAPVNLFVEIALRQDPEARWPLPDTLRVSRLAELANGAMGDEVLARYEQFCRLIAEDQEFPRTLAEVPLATLVSKASRSQREFREYAAGLHKPASFEPNDGVKPRLVPKGSIAGQSVRVPETTGPLAEDAHRTGAAEATKRAEPSEATTAKRQGALSGALAARMLKVAANELSRIKTQDPTRYTELKRTYLEALDEPSRRLLLDVQKRIQPSLFEEQIRQRLVRFMVENPGSWRSAEAKGGMP